MTLAADDPVALAATTRRPTGQAISRTTPLDAAARNEKSAVVDWLRALGAVPTDDA